MGIFHISKTLSASLPNSSLEILGFRGWGQHSPAGLPYPSPKRFEQQLFTDYEMILKCLISYNEEMS